MKKIGILVAVATILASITVPSVLACHTWTPGYWKNTRKHAWPSGSISLCGTTYVDVSTQPQELIGILKTPPAGGDAWIILAQKYIALRLSMLKDSGTDWAAVPTIHPDYTDVVSLADAAETWLCTHPQPCEPGEDGRGEGLDLAEAIDDILNDPDYHQD